MNSRKIRAPWSTTRTATPNFLFRTADVTDTSWITLFALQFNRGNQHNTRSSSHRIKSVWILDEQLENAPALLHDTDGDPRVCDLLGHAPLGNPCNGQHAVDLLVDLILYQPSAQLPSEGVRVGSALWKKETTLGRQ
jgi:hypothetical protein